MSRFLELEFGLGFGSWAGVRCGPDPEITCKPERFSVCRQLNYCKVLKRTVIKWLVVIVNCDCEFYLSMEACHPNSDDFIITAIIL